MSSESSACTPTTFAVDTKAEAEEVVGVNPSDVSDDARDESQRPPDDVHGDVMTLTMT